MWTYIWELASKWTCKQFSRHFAVNEDPARGLLLQNTFHRQPQPPSPPLHLLKNETDRLFDGQIVKEKPTFAIIGADNVQKWNCAHKRELSCYMRA